MEEKKKNLNTVKALIFSLLTSLGGAVVFGIVYGIGYYVFIIPILEVILAIYVYHKFAKYNWANIIISIIWCIGFVLLFNVLSIIVCETIFIATEYGLPFFTSLSMFFEMIGYSKDVADAFWETVFQASAITLFGAVIAGVYYGFNFVRNKNYEKNRPSETKNVQTSSTDEIITSVEKVENKTETKDESTKSNEDENKN